VTNEIRGKRVLAVDDEPGILELLTNVFRRVDAQVHGAIDGKHALRQFYTHTPHLVLLDLMLPDVDGWQVCRKIRELSDVPIIMVTALSHDREIIRGLDTGADDYVLKPFSLDVLLARARALLRRGARTQDGSEAQKHRAGHLSIDLDTREVLVRGEPVKLTATEYRLLAYLVQNAGRVLSFEQILDRVWEGAHQACAEYVHVYVSRLRQKLEADTLQPRYFVSERGVGYRFEKQAPRLK
jgi:two-component system KDP operon response regulator KdpE